MEMNKKYFINELKKKLNYTEEQAIIINDVLDDTFFMGKSNKEKLINGYMEKLNISREEAEHVYDVSSEIIKSSIVQKIKHPFKKIDE